MRMKWKRSPEGARIVVANFYPSFVVELKKIRVGSITFMVLGTNVNGHLNAVEYVVKANEKSMVITDPMVMVKLTSKSTKNGILYKSPDLVVTEINNVVCFALTSKHLYTSNETEET